MIVRGRQITHGVEIVVDPITVLQEIRKSFICKMPGVYIDRDGNWAFDDDRCRLTDVYRKATDEEKQVMESFDKILTMIKDMDMD